MPPVRDAPRGTPQFEDDYDRDAEMVQFKARGFHRLILNVECEFINPETKAPSNDAAMKSEVQKLVKSKLEKVGIDVSTENSEPTFPRLSISAKSEKGQKEIRLEVRLVDKFTDEDDDEPHEDAIYTESSSKPAEAKPDIPTSLNEMLDRFLEKFKPYIRRLRSTQPSG